jgi:glucose-1-phosphate thymidylyltransferase
LVIILIQPYLQQGALMRGVILAGGKGQRLGDSVKVTNKHLLAVYDRPMIYYPLQQLVHAGITNILIISGGGHLGSFCDLLGSGAGHGCSLTYKVQEEAGGIAQALSLAEDFCGGERLVVILGDNVFESPINSIVDAANQRHDWAWIALRKVFNPQAFGVAYIADDQLQRIEEKPQYPTSDLAVTGLYIYPPDVFDIIKTLKPSGRGELEITDVNNHYLSQGRLGYSKVTGYWSDAGTPDSLVVAAQLVRENMPLAKS